MPSAITIDNIQPGPTDADMNPATGDFADGLRRLMALPRHGTADEIAALVAYLAGPEAGFVTGASLTIDGDSLRSAPSDERCARDRRELRPPPRGPRRRVTAPAAGCGRRGMWWRPVVGAQ
jgi:enoyl-ACP reductase-like protein